MTDEVQPRVWVGQYMSVESVWWWDECCQWLIDDEDSANLLPGTVFVSGDQPKPTIDPAEMETIRTCGKVDW